MMHDLLRLYCKQISPANKPWLARKAMQRLQSLNLPNTTKMQIDRVFCHYGNECR